MTAEQEKKTVDRLKAAAFPTLLAVISFFLIQFYVLVKDIRTDVDVITIQNARIEGSYTSLTQTMEEIKDQLKENTRVNDRQNERLTIIETKLNINH